MNGFYDLARRKKWLDARQGVARSNVTMDGKILYIPHSEYERDALPAYACAIDAGARMYLIECNTRPLFKFYLDIDLKENLDDRDVARAAQVADAVVASAYGQGVATVLAARDEKKCGVHIVWSKALTDAEAALRLRQRCVAALREQHDVADWEEALDASVYTGIGLRAVGSRKMRRCECADGCVSCGYTRRVDGGRVYALLDVLLHNEPNPQRLQMLRKNTALLVLQSSIRCTAQPAEAPSLTRTVTTSIRFGDLVHGASEYHANLVVKKVKTGLLNFEDARHCPNVGRKHRSSTQYATATAGGVSIGCYSRHCRNFCLHFQWREGAAAKVLPTRSSLPFRRGPT